MTFEYLRVIIVVYTSALLPLLLVPLLYKRGRLPSWVIGAYLGSFLLLGLGDLVYLRVVGRRSC